eukprot:CAMPEP_0197520440 /NCGR_PEP_ID=MMETSP1318-20131121/5788_1 /TAXON_ID=552666 /ORGANISM="Partenskyella glossopodia, Strain RCC365" /LENGTH=188 /DNA_ID=CAMNT_0043072007 /DNA_START=39 /DNA_END=605 /DNA_ORIENTATION=+
MEALASLLNSILRVFGLGFARKDATVVLLGLDNAGKTCLQHKMKTGETHSFIPTTKPKDNEITIGDVTLTAWDLGGHKAVRKLWKTYYRTADGVVFVVDAADTKRFAEVKRVIAYLLRDQALKTIPIAILGNKSDRKDAVDMVRLREEIGLPKLYSDTEKIKMFRTSVIEGYGYPAAFSWLAANIPER